MSVRKKRVAAQEYKFGVPMAEPSKKIRFKPRNQHQVEALQALASHDLTFLIGPAGTAKTHIAVAYAVQALLDEQYTYAYIARPVVETAGERLGFLPGTYEQKLDPYLTPIYDCIDQLFDQQQAKVKEDLMKRIRVAPIAFVRGRTFTKSTCILDEAQNATLPQLKAWMTRLGLGSKMIITGDPTQTDLREKPMLIPLAEAASRIGTEVALVNLPPEAIVRHRLVGRLIEAFKSIGA